MVYILLVGGIKKLQAKLDSINIPNTWDSLKDFAQWYIENNYPIRVPENARVYPTDVSYSCCVFRQDVYQVEIYLAKPNFSSSKHTHPFEQLIIFLGGHLSGANQNSQTIGSLGEPITSASSSTIPHKQFGRVSSILTPGNWHSISGHDQGFIFFNLQRWSDAKQMTSAVVEYNGDSLGTIHDSIKTKGQ